MFNAKLYSKINSQKIQLQQHQTILNGLMRRGGDARYINLVQTNIQRFQTNISEMERELYFPFTSH